ncbi:ATPase regulatory subunit 1 [Seminavis robusta]|uniref:ATPase regulatory subunit 1 n=1 Tax=Seminavis robusta TaxID=568900 RepID=A0A9N8DTJ4_9STRA|nr:ATPase regulatory subunit 1 [Seminavis robusta]|eukprot:Sro332_g119300.1 ATPase regulatory subunit 1 (1064) ;mRNA; f:36745-40113
MATAMTVDPSVAQPAAVATASGWIALLQESDPTLKSHALKKLLECVDTLWHEVAECLPDLEAIAEDADGCPLEMRQRAAAVASRVFFHLEEPTQALRLALDAGEGHFDVQQATPYVERLVAAALDAYCLERRKMLNDDEEPRTSAPMGKRPSQILAAGEVGLPMDQLQALVHRLLESCCAAGKFDHALGIALEARETEKVRDVLQASKLDSGLLKYALSSCVKVVQSKGFRQEAMAVIAECLQKQFDGGNSLAAYDLILVHQLLGQPNPVAQVLTGLIQGSEESSLLALQLCFDLMDSGDQAFVNSVAKKMKEAGDQDKEDLKERWERTEKVLTGGFPSELALSFLHKHSKADRLIMENLKKSLEERGSGGRSSVLHNAAVMTHSYLYAGTTNDSFLRDYLDWMKKASNWAKFSATASLGVIHASHVTEAMHLLQPYLPANPNGDGDGDGGGTPVSPSGGYAEGGSLYALGLIHGSQTGTSTEKREETIQFLRAHLRASHANEVISHGAALGVGLTALGSSNLAIVNELKEVLDTDSAVAGEAAGIAIGMVLVGSGAGNVHNSLPAADKEELMEVVSELKNYARETQHEKIIRGISMGLALMNYGQEENADALIEEMRSDRDPVLRYGAQYALALAYCGTGSNKAIRILLHTAVSDVSDDVRMASVIGLAFVLYKTPERVPLLVKLLLESFNPHVRYASCIAVGIAMAGTGDSESVSMLEPILDDMTDYVRQGALVGTALIYMQQSDTSNSRKIRSFRERLSNIIGEKHQSTLTKMGAIISTGIIDAGGRNCSLSLGSKNGFTKMLSAVGVTLWLQHWHWYPMMHMFSLALTPTYTIGLNKDFNYPKKYEINCKSKPSVFAYPKKLEEKKEEKKKRVETVTLSTTAKEKARQARRRAKEGDKGDSAMDIDASTKDDEGKGEDKEKKEGDAMDVDAKAEETVEKPKKKKREPEPTSFRIGNPARITIAQSEVCEFDLDQRYRPVRSEEKPFGVIILTDSTPGEEEDLGAVKAPSLEPEGETAPPEPFEWVPPPVSSSDGATAMDTTTDAADDKPKEESAESKSD